MGQPGMYFNLALSPDERRLAVSHSPVPQGNNDIWLFDLAGPTATFRITTAPGPEFDPVWSPPDGAEVVFSAFSGPGGRRLFRRAASGEGQAELLQEVETMPLAATGHETDVSSSTPREVTSGFCRAPAPASPILSSRREPPSLRRLFLPTRDGWPTHRTRPANVRSM